MYNEYYLDKDQPNKKLVEAVERAFTKGGANKVEIIAKYDHAEQILLALIHSNNRSLKNIYLLDPKSYHDEYSIMVTPNTIECIALKCVNGHYLSIDEDTDIAFVMDDCSLRVFDDCPISDDAIIVCYEYEDEDEDNLYYDDTEMSERVIRDKDGVATGFAQYWSDSDGFHTRTYFSSNPESVDEVVKFWKFGDNNGYNG